MTTGSTGSLFPKWQLAILIGAPVAIGIGYLYYRNQNTSLHDAGADNKDRKKLADVKEKTISLDGDDKLSSAHTEKINGQPPAPDIVKKQQNVLEIATQYKNDGNARFKKGKYDEAIELYDQAINKCPKDAADLLSTFYQNRAAAYEQLKKWHAVKSDCTKALELNGRYIKALHRRARAHEYLNELAESLEDVTATCILEGFQNQSSLVFADRVLKQMGREDAKKAINVREPSFPSTNFIQTYLASFTEDPLKKIIVVSTDPKGFVRAKKAFDACDYESIIPACTEEIESSESDAEYKNEATLLRGTFHLLCGSIVEAERDFDTIINNPDASIPLQVNALIKKASSMVQSEEIEKGFELFAIAERLDANNSDIYHQRGQVYVLMEKLDEAANDFTKAMQLSPNHGTTFVQKTFVFYRRAIMQQNEMAMLSVMNDFKKAIDTFPDCVDCYSVMAQVLAEQQQYEEADSFYIKAMEIAPKNASLYVHRGLLQLQWNGDINKALEYMNTGIAIDDKCEFAYETLGSIEVQRANLDKAIELFDRAIKLARTEAGMVHLFALRNAAIAQNSVTKKMGIDMSTLSSLAANGLI